MLSIPRLGKVSDLLSRGYVMAAGSLPAMVFDHTDTPGCAACHKSKEWADGVCGRKSLRPYKADAAAQLSLGERTLSLTPQ
jgi:hypothetical protein